VAKPETFDAANLLLELITACLPANSVLVA
jgi:hypothetical protein